PTSPEESSASLGSRSRREEGRAALGARRWTPARHLPRGAHPHRADHREAAVTRARRSLNRERHGLAPIALARLGHGAVPELRRPPRTRRPKPSTPPAISRG